MCARYTLTKDDWKWVLAYVVRVLGAVPRGDIRPTDKGLVVVPEFEGHAEPRWGWAVPWDKSPLFNARSETLTTLPTFQPHREQRCLLPADGFYEGGSLFHQPGHTVFCCAGLWRLEPGGFRYTMLTTTPNAEVARVHDRMPFIVKPEDFADWLRGDWERVLQHPDKAPLEKFQKQPELF